MRATLTNRVTRAPESDQPASENSIVVQDLHKTFRRRGGAKVNAVDNLSLTIRRGEMCVLLGPSGSGKTSLLRCIAGLEQPELGEIVVDEVVMFSSSKKIDRPPNQRNISMMFQSYALWPHMTVAQNVAYPLKRRPLTRAEVRARVQQVLYAVGMADLGGQHPGQLSGGQQQRVALARTLVTDPKVILFDEPLSNVDAKVREELRVEIMTKQKALGFTGVYVTHDQVEALQLADSLVVLDAGKVAQIGKPQDIYFSPASGGVARFVGTLNEVSATIRAVVAPDLVDVDCALGTMRGRDVNRVFTNEDVGKDVVVGIRAEALHLAANDAQVPPGNNFCEGTMIAGGFAGAYSVCVISVGSLVLSMHTEVGGQARVTRDPAQSARVWFSMQDTMVFRA